MELHEATQALGGIVGGLVTGALGSLDVVLPLLLLGLAWRILRRPDESAATGRITIGVSALVLASCGMVHVAKGTPVPADGQCDFVNYHHDEARNAKGPGKISPSPRRVVLIPHST